MRKCVFCTRIKFRKVQSFCWSPIGIAADFQIGSRAFVEHHNNQIEPLSSTHSPYEARACELLLRCARCACAPGVCS